MAKYISLYAYSKKHKIPFSTIWDRVKAGKIKDIKKVTVTRILINEDYKV